MAEVFKGFTYALIVFSKPYHFPKTFEIVGYEFEKAQFLHCPFELCKLFVKPFQVASAFVHSHLPLVVEGVLGLSLFFG